MVSEQRKRELALLIVVVLAVAALVLFKDHGARRAVKGIPEPVQQTASGETTVDVNGYHLTITYQYSYDIRALVASTHDYHGSGVGDGLSPKDALLIWGKVAEYNDRIDFHWRQGNRWYFWNTDTYEELAPVGGEAGVGLASSNNHLIPADAAVKKKIKKLKKGDYVEIRGYLVSIRGNNAENASFYWNSSTTRADTGDGSCEVIYVTDVMQLD